MFLLIDKKENLIFIENEQELDKYNDYKKIYLLCEYKTNKDYITELKNLMYELISEKKLLKKVYKNLQQKTHKSLIQSLIDNRKNNLKQINKLLKEKNIKNIKSYIRLKKLFIQHIPKKFKKF